MAQLAAQLSVYPLRRTDVAATVAAALAACAARSVTVTPGDMSSIVAGDEDAVFAAIADAYSAAARDGDVVMVLTLSNACPVGAANALRHPPSPR